MTDFFRIPPFSPDKGLLHLIVETPKGCRNKYAYDPEWQVFQLKKVLPVGSSFPFDFGFVPGTIAEDGDPLDALLLMDEPAYPGCLVKSRLLGVLEAEQEEDGKRVRNDRLLAVSEASKAHAAIRELKDLDKRLREEIEHFFMAHNQLDKPDFKILGMYGSSRALKLVKEAEKRYQQLRARKEVR